MRNFLLFSFTLFLFLSCNNNNTHSDTELYIVTTTGMLGDAVKNIVGDKARVESLMGPGVDPHLYKATQSDLDKLNKADLIFYNGLFLEGKMEDILDKLSRSKKAVAVGDRLDPSRVLKTSQTSAGKLNTDPHVWFDVSLWAEVVGIIASAMQEFDPGNAAVYQENFSNYSVELKELHQWVRTEIATIPVEQRVLITSHDAFSYFGRAYEIEVHGLQGISTASDYGLQDVTRLVNLIVERKVKSVFIETSVAARSLQAVVEGCRNLGYDVKIGGTLFSDAMGEPETPEGTYTGMVKANVSTIVNALK
ncbi:MAG TPA: zinc ABC transporter substrate-binding protein [Chitinophagales bacterium]|nr:zinc ABC transporter substrate-binding protein [Chitinophagales bacterium]